MSSSYRTRFKHNIPSIATGILMRGEGVVLRGGCVCIGVEKEQEKKLEVAEMRMLRWMCGGTKMDKIRNERIRGTTKVGGKSQRKSRKGG